MISDWLQNKKYIPSTRMIVADEPAIVVLLDAFANQESHSIGEIAIAISWITATKGVD